MIQPEQLLTSSLAHHPRGPSICRILSSAVNSVDPYLCVQKYLSRRKNSLHYEKSILRLDRYRNVYVVGAGKAVVPMATAVIDVLGEYFTSGCIIVKDGHEHIISGKNISKRLQIIKAGHPIPDSRGIEGTKIIIDLLHTSTADDLVICLLSGGGSSLLCCPAPGITLSDIRSTTNLLLNCGAPISGINTIRKHLDLVKGGRLAQIVAPSELITLILSDVVGDRLDVIASGPTVPDSTTFERAFLILQQYKIVEQVPKPILNYILSGRAGIATETPKPGDKAFTNVHNLIIGSNRLATQAAIKQARLEGFNTLMLTGYLEGEAQQVGKVIAAIAREASEHNYPVSRPACFILGGETTVTVKGNGRGGRNQELALATVSGIEKLERTVVITLATDGGDGATDAAGAVVTGFTYDQAQNNNMDPQEYLDQNNSYDFFNNLSDLIKTGPTQTNVNDIVLIVTY